MSGLTNVFHLSLSNNFINDLSSLSGLPKLKWLYLDNNNITDLSPLATNTPLTVLAIEGNEFSDISTLYNLISLTDLRIRNSPNALCTDIDALESFLTGAIVTRDSNCYTPINLFNNIGSETDSTASIVFGDAPLTTEQALL